MKKKLITSLVILGIWQVASMVISKEVILPLPFDVFNRMLSLSMQQDFYLAISSTLLRILLSFVIALIIGTTLGVLSGLYKTVYEFLYPLFTLLQTIPQIAYILVLLVWFDSLTALIIIVLLMLLPVFYHNAVNGILNIDSELNDVITLYHHSLAFNIWHIYLPLIKGYIQSAIETCLPLSFKVGVMAEIFVSSRQGIGKQLYNARVQIDMVSIFAWIIWMVIIVLLMTHLSKWIVHQLQKRSEMISKD